jgi:DnaJ-class molecular chaperone
MLAGYAAVYAWGEVLEALAAIGYKAGGGASDSRKDEHADGSRESRDSRARRRASSMSLREASDLLGVGPDATLEEIKRAYHSKVAEWHPDKLAGVAQELRDMATERMKQLNEAYEIVSRYATGCQS